MLNSEGVEYLLVGGYAVVCYGVPRATGDMDVWISIAPESTQRLVRALCRFGFADPSITPERFQQPGQVFRMGVPPLRIELLTTISGLEFASAYSRRRTVEIDGVPVSLIDLADLRTNKQAAGRPRDLDDLQNLP